MVSESRDPDAERPGRFACEKRSIEFCRSSSSARTSSLGKLRQSWFKATRTLPAAWSLVVCKNPQKTCDRVARSARSLCMRETINCVLPIYLSAEILFSRSCGSRGSEATRTLGGLVAGGLQEPRKPRPTYLQESTQCHHHCFPFSARQRSRALVAASSGPVYRQGRTMAGNTESFVPCPRKRSERETTRLAHRRLRLSGGVYRTGHP